MTLKRWGTALLLLMLSAASMAQESNPLIDLPNRTWEVFLERGSTGGSDRIIFIDVLTGFQVRADVSGERYTLLEDGVLYFDPGQQRVMYVDSSGVPRPHEFIVLQVNARRIDWAVSDDGKWVAWTLTYGESNALTTVTQIATQEGAMQREVLRDGPNDGIRALPLGFAANNEALIMDVQPDGLARFTAYPNYAGLFRLDLASSEIALLPGEPGCYCGAGMHGNRLLRLSVTPDLGGFDLRVLDLTSDTVNTIPALRLSGFTQAGGILLSPDETVAIYALAQIQDFGTPRQSVRTVFVLADLGTQTQRALTSPITTYVQPLRWTEDNSAIIVTSTQVNGTWKIDRQNGELMQIASASYLGRLKQD